MGRIRMLTIVSAILCALPAIISSQEPANKRLSVPELVKVVSAGIVHIGTMDINGKALGQGSGFVAKPDGTIVTSFHVIEAARAIVVKTSDGEIYDRVEVLDYDRRRDIVVLKIRPFRPLSALQIATDDDLVVGEEAAVVGNPQGLDSTVSTGIVSGYRQAEGFQLIQITAPISPGSSGSPLFNMRGKVVGVATAAVDLPGSQNLNFAVPVTYIRPLLASVTAMPLSEFSQRIANTPSSPRGGGVNDFVRIEWPVIHSHKGYEQVCRGTLRISGAKLEFSSINTSENWSFSLSSVYRVRAFSTYVLEVQLPNATAQNFTWIDDKGRYQPAATIVQAFLDAARPR